MLFNAINHKQAEWEKLERILLTIDGGTLALSVTLLTNRLVKLVHPLILRFSWGFLAASLVFLLLSYAFEEAASCLFISRLKKFEPESILQSETEKLKSKTLELGTSLSNYASLIATILGMVLLVVFGFFNIL